MVIATWINIELVDDDFITQNVFCLPQSLIHMFPYIEQVKQMYNNVFLPERKVTKQQLEQLTCLIDVNCETFLSLDTYQQYESLKSVAEFLLADSVVDRLNDLLCTQLGRMSTTEIANFYQLDTNEEQEQINRDKLEDLLVTYFKSLSTE
jgi:hypothetical protein